MEKYNKIRTILVSACGGDIGTAVLSCLRSEYSDCRLIGFDIKRYNSGLEFLDSFFIAPEYTKKDEYIAFVKKLCLSEGVTHFFPMTEYEIQLWDSERSFFSNNSVALMINEHNTLEICFSKYRTAKWLEKIDVLCPKTFWINDFDTENVIYPVIVKQDFSCGSKTIRVLNSVTEYMSGEYDSDYIVQEYIGDAEHEYTVGVFSDGKKCYSIVYKRILGYGGLSVTVELVDNPEIATICEKVAKNLKLTGCINIQMRKQSGQYYIFEINPRISSTVRFRYLMGFKDLVSWINLVDGVMVNPKLLEIHDKEQLGIKRFEEVVVKKSEIRMITSEKLNDDITNLGGVESRFYKALCCFSLEGKAA